MRNFTQNQWAYLKHWLVLIIIAEIILCVFNQKLPMGYLVIALLFWLGFLLRVFKLYPGKPEPLILDISSGAVAFIFAIVALRILGSNLRFLLIFCSSIIVLPHFIYIISKHDIP